MKSVTQIHFWRRVPLLVLLYLFIAPSFSRSQVQTQKPVYATFDQNIKGYYESLPVNYSSQPTKKFPMIVFLHGNGERGDGSPAQITRVLTNGPPKLISQGKFPSSFTVGGESFSFIVISPQSKEPANYISSIDSLIK